MKIEILTLLTLISSFTITHGQNKKRDKKDETKFIDFSFTLGGGNFKDEATSPLKYSGISAGSGIGFLKINDFRESKFDMNYSIGSFKSKMETKRSLINEIEAKYYYLINLNLKNEKWDLKIGGELNNYTDIRVNESLMNNAFGFENFFTLFATSRISRDISRKTEKRFSFLHYSYVFPARKRTLSYTQNLSLYNSTFRNDYIYINHGFIVNENLPFGNYVTSHFSGFRLASQLDYTHYFQNCNAIRISYKWQAMQTAKDPHRFQLASHKIGFSFLFNTK